MVQGVGFRPLVYHIAKKYGIRGYVRNVGGYVEIMTHSLQEEFERFIRELQKDHGNGSEIVKLDIETLDADMEGINPDRNAFNQTSPNCPSMEEEAAAAGASEDFIIIESENSEEVSILPPDLPVCPKCMSEMEDPANRRYQNPFISCVACGPRYTIIEQLPYDRDHTSMEDFHLCRDCHEEYSSPDNRRHHAQTISCDDCGPYLIFQKKGEAFALEHERQSFIHPAAEENHKMSNQLALEQAVAIIKNGGILAVKGIGGYHFVCSPFQEESVLRLRKLKGREEKPFAVMFESMESIRQYCRVSLEEEKLLMTKARPIVLLYMHKDEMAPSTNQGSIYCGAFLPYTPLQLLLTRACGPLIMTSANLSGKPMIRDDKEILSLQSPYLQGVLYHTRRIVRSVDDSVAKIINHQPQLIRRSRGYVPYPVFLPLEEEQEIEEKQEQKLETKPEQKQRFDSELQPGLRSGSGRTSPVIFAAGGDLKAAYCLYKSGAAVVSQYFGDLEEESILEEYIRSKEDIEELLKMHPTLAVCDLHPNYHSTRYARKLGLPLILVQHHHAHIASVMAEHGLRSKVIGIAFDGTGYGTDGNIWGGEFLLCEGAEFIRAAHLAYTPILGGDQSMKDAKKTASCYLLKEDLGSFSQDERIDTIQAALKHKVNTVLTSSMGRLFDAVASLLDLGHSNLYEGECAANLEREAVFAIRENIKPIELSFAIRTENEIMKIEPGPLLKAICELREREDKRALALGFHYAVADMILEIAKRIREKEHTDQVALSGGVFQNTVLTERSCQLLRENGFQVYYNLAVPPNDGCISLGQTYVGLMKYQESET